MYCKRRIDMASSQRAHCKPTQHAHGALEDPKAFKALCLTLCANAKPWGFFLSMLKTNAASWRSRRLHRLHLALLATACTLAIFYNAVGTL